jgi:hypothetical protein
MAGPRAGPDVLEGGAGKRPPDTLSLSLVTIPNELSPPLNNKCLLPEDLSYSVLLCPYPTVLHELPLQTPSLTSSKRLRRSTRSDQV